MPTGASRSDKKIHPLVSEETKTNVSHDQLSSHGAVVRTDRNLDQPRIEPGGGGGAGQYKKHPAPHAPDDCKDARIDVAELEQRVGVLTDADAKAEANGKTAMVVVPLGGWREEMGSWGDLWAFAGFARWMD